MKNTCYCLPDLCVVSIAMVAEYDQHHQSAAWVRTMVGMPQLMWMLYYNPAGLLKLIDGFHFSLNNQFFKQRC
jgi:hypothetical protein